MLRRLTTRRPGEEAELTLERSFIRCALVLVAKRQNLSQDMEKHVRYIQDILAPRQIDRVYLLSDKGKQESLDALAEALGSDWQVTRKCERRAVYSARDRILSLYELTAMNDSFFPSATLGFQHAS